MGAMLRANETESKHQRDPSSPGLGRRGQESSRGQIAIFIALIFQVLFVFFAMAINVALVVHDKINLQNAADLAAYYAAGKQAEVLNAIAHSNYQIRQAFKLLVFRYRVWGNMGTENLPGQNGHPSLFLAGSQPDEIYQEGGRDSFPVCVVFDPTWDVPRRSTSDENICNRPDLQLPRFPTVELGNSPFPIARTITQVTRNLRDAYSRNCEDAGEYNRFFAESSLAAFANDQYSRKQVLYGLADNLSRSEFLDLDGLSIKTGALETFRNNLTFANSSPEAFNPQEDFEVLNSLAGVDAKTWLRPMVISVDMPFSVRSTTGAGECSLRGISSNKNVSGAAPRPPYRRLIESGLITTEQAAQIEGIVDALYDNNATRPGPQHNNRFAALGVEKNPWYLAYVGVKAKTRPRALFFPFGPRVEFTARAFAKPFGGTIGPWMKHTWPRGAEDSGGLKVDPLAPDRTSEVLANPATADNPFLNYSRFPGDRIGMRSRAALSAFLNPDPSRSLRQFAKLLKLSYFVDLDAEPAARDRAVDYLVRNRSQTGPELPTARGYEIAAVAPDLFDVTYYAIEPNYSAVYQRRLLAARDRLNLGSVGIRGDLGGLGETTEAFNIHEQINAAKERLSPAAYWALRKTPHLLTGFVYTTDQLGEYDFNDGFPSRLLGQCADDDNRSGQLLSPGLDNSGPLIPLPGSCLSGGKTGYSVKIVSEAWLNSDSHINGPSVGEIINSPRELGF
jgi:hypothetical protein